MHSNSGSNGRANLPTTPAIARIWLTLALIVGCTLLRGATPAKAGGQIFAEIYLQNNTSYAIPIPFSGAQTPQLWGTYGNTLDSAGQFSVMPDGTPPRCLGPGQVMFFGTKSNGGFGATTGTGGTLAIQQANPSGTAPNAATISWSAPWGYFNGLWDSCAGSGPLPPPFGPGAGPNITVTGGAVGGEIGGSNGATHNACSFVFVLNETPNAPAASAATSTCSQVCAMNPQACM
jgi:hypothetical protein